jgi:ERCC4-type nuclease
VIVVDYRTGSKELVPHLEKLGLECHVDTLEFGDFAFEGFGPSGPINVGIERKTIGDLVSCIVGGRYAGTQLPGMLATYQESYLIVEGTMQPGEHGELMTYNGHSKSWQPYRFSKHNRERFTYSMVNRYLLTLTRAAGVKVIKTHNMARTAQELYDLYHHCRKPWEKHQTLHTFNTVATVVSTMEGEADLARRIAKELPGVGWVKSAKLANHYETAWSMLHAILEWPKELEGIVGKAVSDRIYKAVRERRK